MNGHRLFISGSAKVNQEMVYHNGAFEIEEERVLRRLNAREVECSCGEKFTRGGWEVSDAKKHLKNVEWEAEHLPDDEDPLRRGDVIQVPQDDGQGDWKVVDVEGNSIEVHMDGGILPIDERQRVRSAIEKTRDGGTAVRVLDKDGNTKAI